MPKPYPPMHPIAYEARVSVLHQHRAWVANPAAGPAADLDALLPHAAHGSISGIEPEWREGSPVVGVYFYGTHGTKARIFDLGDFLSLDFALAFGGGVTLNDNGNGLSYPQLRMRRPVGRKLYVPRLLTDAGPAEVAKLHDDGGYRGDYHDLRRVGLTWEPLEITRRIDKPMRTPRLGRPALYQAAASYFQAKQPRSGIATSLGEHLTAIRLGFELEDQRHAARQGAKLAAE